MKIIFEYEHEIYTIVKGLKLHTINERTPEPAKLDTLLSDPKVKRMYIIANDNRLW